MNACPSAERLTRHADRDLSPEESAALAAHLAECPACRAELDALGALIDALRAPAVSAFDASAHARSVLERIDQRAPAAHSVKRRRVLVWGALTACAASALLFVRAAQDPADHWQARGGSRPGSIARDVGVQLYETEPTLRALAPGAPIAADARLTAGYRNLGEQAAYLLLFAVDAEGSVHWLAPAYLERGSDPNAVPLQPARDERLLPHTVQLDGLQPGDLRVMTVITRSPEHVSRIEALERGGVSAHSITAAMPQAEVRELRLQVSEVSR